MSATGTRPRALRVVIVIENMSFTYDTRVKNIARTLRQAGCEVWVISPKYPGDPFRRVTEGVTAYFYPVFSLPGGLWGHLVEYTVNFFSTLIVGGIVFGASRFDAIHICNPPDMYFPLGVLARLLGRKFVFDLHDLCPELCALRFPRLGAAHWLLLTLERWAVRTANHVFVTSETARLRICARTGVPPARVTLVRNGPDIARFPKPAARDEAGGVGVGYIGDMNPQDGIDNLLGAAHYLRHALGRTDIHYVLIGDGSAFETLRRKAATLGIADVVTFTGRMPHAAAMRRLAGCRLCVQPDLKNGFNDSCVMVKSLEYMALGKPLVAFDLTETQRVCGDAALYATNNHPHSLAARIVQLADDPELCARLGQIGRRRVEEQFAWSFSEKHLLATYRNLLPGDVRAWRGDNNAQCE